MDKRLAKKGDPLPQETVSGGVVPIAPDRVTIGNGYYAVLDRPHHKDTQTFVTELKALVSKPPRKKKVETDESV